MRVRVWKNAVLLAAAVLFWEAAAFPQSGATDESKRKVKTRVAPVYPDLAKRMNVYGKVKIEVVIAPDGRIKSTRVIGGHPLLTQACQDALKDWRFMPGPEETTQIMEFDFRAGE